MNTLFTEKTHNKLFIYVITVAFLIRLGFVLFQYKNEVWNEFADDHQRQIFAEKIIHDGFIPAEIDYSSIEFVIAPFVPSVLALKTFIFGASWLPVFLLNVVIGTFTCWLIYRIALKYTNRNVALLSLAWAAVYPNFIRYTATAGNEPWLVFMFVLAFYFYSKVINSEKSVWNILWFGISFAVLIHTDERYLAYFPLYIFFLIMGTATLKMKIKRVFLFSFFVFLLSTPWLIRNLIVFGEPVLISTRTTSLTDPLIHHRKELKFDHTPGITVLSPAQIDSIIAGTKTTFQPGFRISELQIKEMRKGNIPHRFPKTESYLSRLYFMWMAF